MIFLSVMNIIDRTEEIKATVTKYISTSEARLSAIPVRTVPLRKKDCKLTVYLTEGRNTGFRKILNALERNGSSKPVFETDPERLSFCTTLLIHPHFLHQGEGKNVIANNKATAPNQKKTMSEMEQKILALILGNKVNL